MLPILMSNGANGDQSTVEVHTTSLNSSITASEQLVAALKGKIVKVPNMMDAMKGWPVDERHPQLERLRAVFDETLDRYFYHSTLLLNRKKSSDIDTV